VKKLYLYCFDDAHFESTLWFKKTEVSCSILLESLQDLDNNLRKMGSGLVILKENQKWKF
jgi:deoxyribodipyrimidine photo-lyase